MDKLITSKSVSIIIVTWNSEGFIKDAVETALAQSHKNLEIIIIDNGSSDKTVKTVKSLFSKNKQVKLIVNRFNIGFAAANNQGLYIANGEFILFLNPDTKLDKKYLTNALKGFEDPSVGAVSGKIFRFDGKTIDSAGQMLGKSRRAVERGYGKQDSIEYSTEEFCFSVCGAAALYRRAAIAGISINGQFFDESYFAFYEDLDAGWRLNLLGWKCKYIPAAIVYHHRGGSNVNKKGLSGFYQIAGKSSDVQADIIRNRWYTIIKNDHILSFAINFPWIFFQDLKTMIYLLFFNRKIIGKVFRTFFHQLPSLMKKRKIVKMKIKIKRETIRKRMKL
jgi:GT2 family glycosyltransferase